eukprot:SAG22_NODE_12588_length_437_cov_0.704142_1_plen_50_part_10
MQGDHRLHLAHALQAANAGPAGWEQAKAEFEKAVELAPNNPMPYFSLGLI